MKDSDVRAVLEELAQDKEISVEVNTPYREVHYIGGFRVFDKIYSLDDMTVFAEMKLGTKLRQEGNPEEVTYRVTLEEQEAWRQKLGKASGLSAREAEGKSLLELFGVLVDYADDAELSTGTVVMVAAQYEIENLAGLLNRPEWAPVINAAKDKYNAEIGDRISEFVDGTPKRHGGVIIPGRGMPSYPSLVFKRIITKDEDLREGITSVYNAGSAIKKALDAKTAELMQYV